LLDFVNPRKEEGVHSIDITTIRMPNGEYQVLSCLLWGSCTGPTSHYTEAGFTIDIQTECIAQKLYQYGAYFNKPGFEEYIGKKISGIQKAVQFALKAHENVNKEQPFAVAVGWDCMFTDKDDQIVFFEGNLAMARAPRMMFLNHHNTLDFINDIYWPFDRKRSSQTLA